MAWDLPALPVTGTVISVTWGTQVRDSLSFLSTHAHSGAAGDGAASVGSNFKTVVLNTAAQSLEFWDNFDGYTGLAGQNRYVANSVNPQFIVDATTGRSKYRSSETSLTVGFKAELVANLTFTPRAAENWAFKVLIGEVTAPVGGTVDVYAGFRADLTTGQSDGIYFRSSNSGNWFLVCRSAGVETTVDMGVSFSATVLLLEFRISSDGASVQGYLNGTLTGAAITTNIPAGLMRVTVSKDNRVATVTTAVVFDVLGWGWKGDMIA